MILIVDQLSSKPFSSNDVVITAFSSFFLQTYYLEMNFFLLSRYLTYTYKFKYRTYYLWHKCGWSKSVRKLEKGNSICTIHSLAFICIVVCSSPIFYFLPFFFFVIPTIDSGCTLKQQYSIFIIYYSSFENQLRIVILVHQKLENVDSLRANVSYYARYSMYLHFAHLSVARMHVTQ